MSQSSMFGQNCMTNYTHMYEFLQSTAAILASDKTEPKSGKHQMPRESTSSGASTDSRARTHAHMLTDKSGLLHCICQVMHMICLQMRTNWKGSVCVCESVCDFIENCIAFWGLLPCTRDILYTFLPNSDGNVNTQGDPCFTVNVCLTQSL